MLLYRMYAPQWIPEFLHHVPFARRKSKNCVRTFSISEIPIYSNQRKTQQVERERKRTGPKENEDGRKGLRKRSGLQRVSQWQKSIGNPPTGIYIFPRCSRKPPLFARGALLSACSSEFMHPCVFFRQALAEGVPKVDMIKPALWFSACLGSVLMVFGINRFASSHVSPTRARSMALRTKSQFCLTRTATGGLLLVSLCHVGMRTLPAKRANVNAALGTWLAVGSGVGARRTERAVGVCQKRAIMCHGMSAFLI